MTRVRGPEASAPSNQLGPWPVRGTALRQFGLAYVALVALGLSLGFLLTGPMAASVLAEFDSDLAVRLAEERTPIWDSVTAVGSYLADTYVMIAAIAILTAGFAWYWKRWRESLTLGFGMALEALVFLTVSLTVGRDRPPVDQLDISPPTASFPSGHTGAAFTFYGALALIVFWNTKRTFPRLLAAVGASLTAISVGAARLYRGMHYLTDVVVGAGLGLICLAIAATIVDRAVGRRDARGAT